jgi:hypothetical protein
MPLDPGHPWAANARERRDSARNATQRGGEGGGLQRGGDPAGSGPQSSLCAISDGKAVI